MDISSFLPARVVSNVVLMDFAADPGIEYIGSSSYRIDVPGVVPDIEQLEL